MVLEAVEAEKMQKKKWWIMQARREKGGTGKNPSQGTSTQK